MRESVRGQKSGSGHSRLIQDRSASSARVPLGSDATRSALRGHPARLPEVLIHLIYGGSGSGRIQFVQDLQRTHGNQAVMRTVKAAKGEVLQRVCAARGSGKGSCPGCGEEDRAALRRKVRGDSLQVTEEERAVPPTVHGVLRSLGQPLDPATRTFFESRFGHELSEVRVHTDAQAAESAQAVNALAYAVTPHIVFGAGQYAPGTTEGRRLIAHELTHLVQQASGTVQGKLDSGRPGDVYQQEADRVAYEMSRENMATIRGITTEVSTQQSPGHLQRLVRTSLVACPAGQNPFSADRRASTLLDNALARIDSAVAERPADPAHADVVTVGNAMRTAFRLNPANNDNWTLAAPHFGLPLIRRRLEIAKNYIDSVVFTVNCVAAGGAHVIPGCAAGACDAGTEAFSCHANPSAIDVCPLFWARNLNQRGRIWLHEVLHIDFGFIDDWGQPDRANAHCYAQFVALLNGFNSPTGFRCH